MLGPAPVVDFDQTLARLELPWPKLRRAVGVTESIDELWSRPDSGGWDIVTEAEVAAASLAEPVMEVLLPLEDALAVAILTSNSRSCGPRVPGPVRAARSSRQRGRRARDPRRAEARLRRRSRVGSRCCVDASSAARGDEPVVYVGDADYELEFARRLGVHAVAVADLEQTE